MSEKEKIRLSGRIDSNNAPQLETDLLATLAGKNSTAIEFDAKDLEYISSAGLRVLLRIRKTYPDISIVNVSQEVYDIFDMTGFTEMMDVQRAYREVSIEGCEEIGRGANGRIYRIDQDNVVKVYKNPDALEDIKHEREVAKLALILGLPTAISYDVVKVGDSYGSVFELLNARSFSQILASEPEKMDWCVDEFVKLLRKVHDTEVPEGKLPDMKETAISWVQFLQDYLPNREWMKLMDLVQAVPKDNHMIHGDYHTKNVVLQGDEVLIIDMDTLAVGNPVFELASMFNAFIGFSEYDHVHVLHFMGFDYETSTEFWHRVLKAYLNTTCETKVREVEDKARIIGYTRLIRRYIRRGGLEIPEGKAEITFWKQKLISLIDNTDNLTFSLDELETDASTERLADVQQFISEKLERADCPMKVCMQIEVAVEEIFVNIASYAYAPLSGKAKVRVELSDNPSSVSITFIDHGVPYNPLAKVDPDVHAEASDRPIGGLGIYMTKKMMDDVTYEYKDGENILTLKKNL